MTILFVLVYRSIFIYALAHKAWLFQKFILELEVFSYSFKINSVLVRQLLPLIKMVLSSTKLSYFSFMVSYLYTFNPNTSIEIASTPDECTTTRRGSCICYAHKMFRKINIPFLLIRTVFGKFC